MKVVVVVLILFTAHCVAAYIPGSSPVMSAEKRLLQHLLTNYELITLHGRPVRNTSSTVQVRFGIGLIQMELDEKEKVLSLSLWSKMSWEDEYLQWEPQQYEGLQIIKLNVSLIWIPDIMLYNTAETESHTRVTQASVYHNGTVVWMPHQKLKSSCSIDVTNFPFDNQKCHMWFGSWTYTTHDINLTMAFREGLDMSEYKQSFQDSNQFEIVKLIAERHVMPSLEEHPNYAVLTYTLFLRRNVVFASYILTLPCVFLACLTLVVFWLPPDRPDRTALAMSIFASFLLLLLILVEAAPNTSTSIPLLGVYYCFNMVIIMLAIFLSSLVVNVCRLGEDQQPVPSWLRKVFLEGPLKCLCICNGLVPSSEIHDASLKHPLSRRSYPDQAFTTVCKPLLRAPEQNGTNKPALYPLNKRTQRDLFLHQQKCANGDVTATPITGSHASHDSTCGSRDAVTCKQLIGQIQDVSQAVAEMERSVIMSSKESVRYLRAKRDWTNISIILDRIFFLTYVAIIVLSITFLFPRRLVDLELAESSPVTAM